MISAISLSAFAYVIGILLSPVVSVSSLVIFVVIALSIYVIRLFLKKGSKTAIPIVLIMSVFGCIRFYTSYDSSLYNAFPEKYVTVEGTIESIPSVSGSTYKYKYTLNVSKLSYLGKSYKINKKIMLNTKEKFKYGDIVTARGFLKGFKNNGNEFDFDYEKYYSSMGITAKLTAKEILKTGEQISHTPSFVTGKLKYLIYENIVSSLTNDDAAFISFIILGNKTLFKKEYKNLLLRTGAFSLFNSPFIHLSILFLFAELFFRNSKNKNRLSIILIFLYIVFENSSPIALKTGLLAWFVLCGKNFKGYSNKLDVLAVIVLTLTSYQPMLCFNPGFMMSVTATVLIYFSFNPIYDKISKIKYIPRFLQPILTIWIILTVGSLPYSAYYFNGITPYSIFFTPFTIPVTAVIFILSAFLFTVPGAYHCFSFLHPVLDFLLKVIKYIPGLIEKLPFYRLFLRTPTEIEVILYSLIWILFIRILKSKFHTEGTKILSTISAALVLCIFMESGINSLNIYFINVGQGDSAVINSWFNETVLIDGGGSADYYKGYNIGENVCLPYLISHGFSHIDVAILTHFHSDHAEGVISAMENLDIDTLIIPDACPDNENRIKLQVLAKSKNVKTEFLNPGDKIKFRSGLTFTLLAPDQSLLKSNNENNTSLVFKVNYGKFSALFMGDFENEENLSVPENIDLLKVSHHGSVTGNSKEFLEKVSPEFSVISVAQNNSYGLPDDEVITCLDNLNSRILRTDILGDIRFKISKRGNIKYSSLYGGY